MTVILFNFNIDAARMWNVTPGEIRASTTKTEAKHLIWDFVKTPMLQQTTSSGFQKAKSSRRHLPVSQHTKDGI
jgi:hypothetical protein